MRQKCERSTLSSRPVRLQKNADWRRLGLSWRVSKMQICSLPVGFPFHVRRAVMTQRNSRTASTSLVLRITSASADRRLDRLSVMRAVSPQAVACLCKRLPRRGSSLAIWSARPSTDSEYAKSLFSHGKHFPCRLWPGPLVLCRLRLASPFSYSAAAKRLNPNSTRARRRCKGIGVI
jgi:hypothetical protein